MVKTHNLTKMFGTSGISDISIDIPRGSVCTIIGRSGAGKSLLLKSILGLVEPDEGSVFIDGTDIYKASYDDLKEVRKSVGVLFQNNALFDSQNVYENVSLPFSFGKRRERAETDRRVAEILSTVYLDGTEKKCIHQLSGGMQKRVAIARALINDPDILFYDEPITGLDPITASGIVQLIGDLCGRLKKTTVIITHDLKGFIEFTDLILLIENGKSIFFGTKDDFMKFDNNIANAYLKMAGYL